MKRFYGAAAAVAAATGYGIELDGRPVRTPGRRPLALALWQSDLFVEGGHFIGFPLALAALAVSFWAPKWLARRWREPPAP